MKNLKHGRKQIFILTVMMTLAAGLTGCSTFGGRSNSPFAPQIESASGAFEDHNPASAGSFKPLPEMTPEEIERLGDIAFSRGNLTKAFIRYEKCLKAEPENKRVIYKKGLVLLAGKVNDEAATVFKSLISDAPDYALAYEGLGRACYQMEDFDNAEAAFRNAVALDVRLWKSHNYLGLIHHARKEYDLAIDAYISAIAEKPRQAEIHENLGLSYTKAGNYREAVAAFGNAIENGMDNSRVYNNLGMALAKAGHYDKALAAFTRAGGKSKAYNNLGCIYLSEEKYGSAVSCFERALNASPAFYEAASRNLKQAQAGLYNDSSQ